MTSPRPDTRFLGTSPLSTDLSQRLTNLSSSGNGFYETNSARTAISGTGSGRAIELAAEISTATTGVLVDHGTGASYRIAVSAGGNVVFSNTNGTLATLAAPSVSGSLRDYVVAWSTEPNPQTTGAGDAQRSEFLVCDVATGGLAQTVATHASVTASPTGTLTLRGVYTGGLMTLNYTSTAAVDAVRISSRFHTRVETREHFVSQTSSPVVIGIQACQQTPFPASAMLSGEVAGPAYQAAAASMQATRNRHRLCSSVIAWQMRSPAPSYEDDLRDTGNAKHVWTIPDGWGGWNNGTGWQARLSWLACVRVPAHIEHVRVKVQWATWKVTPVTTKIVELRVHSSNASPKAASQTSTKLISRTADDGVNALGVQQVFGPLPVNRGDDGYTWIWMSARIDSGSGTSGMAWSLHALSVQPWALPDGYDGGAPNALGP